MRLPAVLPAVGVVTSAAAALVKAASPRPREAVPGGGNTAVWHVTSPGAHAITLEDVAGLIGGFTIEDAAMQVPAFCQGVTLISATCGAFPWWSHKGDYVPLPDNPILTSPDPEVPASVTWTRIYRDMVLYPYAWGLVLSRYADGFPARMRHVPYAQVNVGTDYVTVDGKPVEDRDLIRFDSPTAPGALWNGRRILATSVLIEEATRRYARMDIPSGTLKQTAGPDLLDQEIDDLLTGWEDARQRRVTGFLSNGIEWKEAGFDPLKLQLVEARDANAKDLARLLNLPPSAVNAETGGSLTYSTVEMQQQSLLNVSLVPYLDAVRNRLSMPDITPRGTQVAPAYRDFLRADLTQQVGALIAATGGGLMTVDEARQVLHLPAIGSIQ